MPGERQKESEAHTSALAPGERAGWMVLRQRRDNAWGRGNSPIKVNAYSARLSTWPWVFAHTSQRRCACVVFLGLGWGKGQAEGEWGRVVRGGGGSRGRIKFLALQFRENPQILPAYR